MWWCTCSSAHTTEPVDRERLSNARIDQLGQPLATCSVPPRYLHLAMRRRTLLLALLLLAIVVPEMAWAQGCAMCKAVVESGEGSGNIFGGEQAVGKGLNTGILYLMAVPYVLLFLLFRKRIVGFVKEFAGAQG